MTERCVECGRPLVAAEVEELMQAMCLPATLRPLITLCDRCFEQVLEAMGRKREAE